MEAALGVVVLVLVAMLGWIWRHIDKCSDFHERVAKLEEWKRQQEGKL